MVCYRSDVFLLLSIEVHQADHRPRHTPSKGKLTATVLDVAQGVLGETLEEDAPLMEAGLDSLSAVDFRNQARLLINNLGNPVVVTDFLRCEGDD